jgi:hypothetical protein
MDMEADRREILARRRRGIILKLIRENHESQDQRYTDGELWAMLLKIGQTVGRANVVTLLQDLQVLEYIDFKSTPDEEDGRLHLSEIMLTATGLRFYTRHRSNEDVSFN